MASRAALTCAAAAAPSAVAGSLADARRGGGSQKLLPSPTKSRALATPYLAEEVGAVRMAVPVEVVQEVVEEVDEEEERRTFGRACGRLQGAQRRRRRR